MDKDKAAELLKMLQIRTQEGKIAWEIGVDEESFVAGFPGSSVGISGTWNPATDLAEYRLQIYNKNGVLVEQFMNSGPMFGELESPTSTPVEGLYQLVRRTVLRADEAVDTILESLKLNNELGSSKFIKMQLNEQVYNRGGRRAEEGDLADGWSYEVLELYGSAGSQNVFQGTVYYKYDEARSKEMGHTAIGFPMMLGFTTLPEAIAATMGYFTCLRRLPGYPNPQDIQKHEAQNYSRNRATQ